MTVVHVGITTGFSGHGPNTDSYINTYSHWLLVQVELVQAYKLISFCVDADPAEYKNALEYS